MGFYDPAFEVAEAAQGVSIYFRACVLRHYQSIPVIQVGQAECALGHFIEKFLLGFKVVLDSLVIIQMVTCQIGEDTSRELQAADTFLCNGMRTDFHEGIFAAGISHLSQQPVQGDRVGGGMLGRYRLVVDVIAYGGNQTYFIAEVAECII